MPMIGFSLLEASKDIAQNARFFFVLGRKRI